jgi:hypothetical protein
MRWRTTGVRDRVDHEGECVVLVGAQVVRLSALATAVLDHCADWCGAEELAARLAAEFGEPPGGDAAAATNAVVAELERLGLLESG